MARPMLLIVDDEPLIRETLRLNLEDQGYRTDTAASGEQAVAMLDNGYDLIITDLIMEGLDGLEVLRQARQRRPDQSVFILTGYGELESAINALRLGAQDYLLKPYNHDELVLRVAKNLADRRLRQTLRLYESLLSICSDCKKIRDPQSDTDGQHRWITVEQFISQATGSDLTHGICPDCYRKKMSELKDLVSRGALPARN